jgi:hypothetical protein
MLRSLKQRRKGWRKRQPELAENFAPAKERDGWKIAVAEGQLPPPLVESDKEIFPSAPRSAEMGAETLDGPTK